MSFTATWFDATTKEPLTDDYDIQTRDAYCVSTCDLDGSRVLKGGQYGERASCAQGHRWAEVETLDAADTRVRLSEGGSWRLLDEPVPA